MTDPLIEEGLDYFEKSGDEGDKVYVNAIRAELAQQEARIARLEQAIDKYDTLAIDSVEIHEALNESPAQSLESLRDEIKDELRKDSGFLAAIKAAALREAADELGGEVLYKRLHNRADRIEREALEENHRENRDAEGGE